MEYRIYIRIYSQPLLLQMLLVTQHVSQVVNIRCKVNYKVKR